MVHPRMIETATRGLSDNPKINCVDSRLSAPGLTHSISRKG